MAFKISEKCTNYAEFAVRNNYGNQSISKSYLKNMATYLKYENLQNKFKGYSGAKKAGIIFGNIIKYAALVVAYTICCATLIGILVPVCLERDKERGVLNKIAKQRFGSDYSVDMEQTKSAIIENEKDLNQERTKAIEIKHAAQNSELNEAIAIVSTQITELGKQIQTVVNPDNRGNLLNELQTKNVTYQQLLTKHDRYAKTHALLQSALGIE